MYKHVISSLIAISASASAFAAASNYYPDEFTNLLNGNTSFDVKSEIFNVLDKSHLRTGDTDKLVDSCEGLDNCHAQRMNSYREARQWLFGDLYLDNENGTYTVTDVYCNEVLRDGDFHGKAHVGKMTIPNHQFINCEHTWPQSKFSHQFSVGLQKGDLHHLFPATTNSNSTRSNHPFGETNGKTLNNCEESRSGRLEDGSASGTYFEPPEEHKGNVARAMFYFSVRYKKPIDPIQEKYFREWHKSDPVDAFEMARNDRIEEIQYNRNPFIDYPELVDEISDF